jgi:hypothetical protein
VDETAWLADRFSEHRSRLRGMAYRMLGSIAEADEAVQDAWLRASQSGSEGIENLGGWFTTIVARLCLSALQARKAKREDSAGLRMPDPILSRDGPLDPEQQVLLADSIGLALQIVLDTLPPTKDSHSSFTTCSTSRSTRSQRCSGARPPRQGNSPVAGDDECRGRRSQHRTLASPRARGVHGRWRP